MTFPTRLTAAVLCGALAVASLPAIASAHPARGELLDVVPVSTMDTAQLVTYLGDHDLDASRVRFAVDAKRITYRTIDPTGKPTTASALIALPRNTSRSPRQVTWLHGTTGYRGSVASVSDGNDRAAALLFASAGYLTTAPDYLGLGTGPSVYCHQQLKKHGAKSTLIDLGADVNHGKAAKLALPRILAGFDRG